MVSDDGGSKQLCVYSAFKVYDLIKATNPREGGRQRHKIFLTQRIRWSVKYVGDYLP